MKLLILFITAVVLVHSQEDCDSFTSMDSVNDLDGNLASVYPAVKNCGWEPCETYLTYLRNDNCEINS